MCVESVYSARLRPSVSVLGLDQTLVLRVRDQLREHEVLLVVELVARGHVAGDDDVGPVAATHQIQPILPVILKEEK